MNLSRSARSALCVAILFLVGAQAQIAYAREPIASPATGWIHFRQADADRSIRLDRILLVRLDPLAARAATLYGLPAGDDELVALGKVQDDAFDRLHATIAQSWIRLGGTDASRIDYVNLLQITEVSISTGVGALGEQANISIAGVRIGIVTDAKQLTRLKETIGTAAGADRE